MKCDGNVFRESVRCAGRFMQPRLAVAWHDMSMREPPAFSKLSNDVRHWRLRRLDEAGSSGIPVSKLLCHHRQQEGLSNWARLEGRFGQWGAT